jgi:uncharacterized protein (TIRG00374 family)
MNRRIYKLYRFAFWILPLVIFYLIFQKIDLHELRSNISKADPWLIAMGIAYYPLVIMIGASRWHSLLIQFNQKRVKIGFTFKHYWIGLALGFFAPASLGWDAYRVVVSGRYFGKYPLNAAVILVEKFLALITCSSMIIALYPLVPIDSNPKVMEIVHYAYILFILAILLLLILNITIRNNWMDLFLEKIEITFSRILSKIIQKANISAKEKKSDVSFKERIEQLTNKKKLIHVLLLSFGIQVVSAIGNQVFFKALAYNLPFIVNLFVLPILFFIFLLPISFGSLGIREGAYIILYGLFGVPVEIALIVSFFNLAGILLNNFIGGILMLISNFNTIRKKTLS